ncbi:hypothetical protein QWJ20_10705 [Pectobacterium sp. S5]|uniref:mobilome CxxCx(11)CxxC protein n=1 Tax=Pectobacterium TaxID=122277 RepID=UPI003D9BE61A
MITENEKLDQIRTNALSAEYIYSEKLRQINKISLTITVLTTLTPIAVLCSQLVTKGEPYGKFVDTIAIIISCVLFCLTILSLILRLEQKKESYLQGRRDNIYISNEIDSFKSNSNLDKTWFYKFVSEQDKKDLENIAHIDKKMQQSAYRHALKKLIPGNANVVCAFCKKSPFIFIEGECDACGNTSKKGEEDEQ